MTQYLPKTLPKPIIPSRPVPLHSIRHSQRQNPNFHIQVYAFSTTPHLTARKGTPRRIKADGNKNRGVSAMRHTGLREPLSVSKYPLPKPVLDPDLRDKPTTDENHGLWGFFNKERTRLSRPGDEVAHGRAWEMAELRQKSWEDLHCLWWVCAKDRNRIATENVERQRLRAAFGESEAKFRTLTIEKTQKNIKAVLSERYLAWELARREAMNDDTVDLSGEGPAFEPFLQEPEGEDEKRDSNAPVEI